MSELRSAIQDAVMRVLTERVPNVSYDERKSIAWQAGHDVSDDVEAVEQRSLR